MKLLRWNDKETNENHVDSHKCHLCSEFSLCFRVSGVFPDTGKSRDLPTRVSRIVTRGGSQRWIPAQASGSKGTCPGSQRKCGDTVASRLTGGSQEEKMNKHPWIPASQLGDFFLSIC